MICQRKYALYLHCLHDYWFCYENYKNHPQVYLEECKYKIKKIKMSKFINSELKFDAELVAKLESGPDSE